MRVCFGEGPSGAPDLLVEVPPAEVEVPVAAVAKRAPMTRAEAITATPAAMELKVPTFLKAIRPASSPATGPKEATRRW